MASCLAGLPAASNPKPKQAKQLLHVHRHLGRGLNRLSQGREIATESKKERERERERERAQRRGGVSRRDGQTAEMQACGVKGKQRERESDIVSE